MCVCIYIYINRCIGNIAAGPYTEVKLSACTVLGSEQAVCTYIQRRVGWWGEALLKLYECYGQTIAVARLLHYGSDTSMFLSGMKSRS